MTARSLRVQPFRSDARLLAASARSSRLLAVSATDASRVTLLDLHDDHDLAPHTIHLGTSTVTAIALSDDGACIAIGIFDPVARRSAVQMWNTADRTLAWDVASVSARSLAFACDGVLAIAGGNVIYRLDCATRTWREPLYKKSSRVPSTLERVATHGALVAAGTLSTNGKPGLVQLFDLTTGKFVIEVGLKSGACRYVAFSTDGTTLFAADSTGVHFVDTSNWKRGASIRLEGTPPVAAGLDGRSIVVAHGTELSIRDVTGAARTVRGHVAASVIVAVPPDEIVTFACDGAGERWSVADLATAPACTAPRVHPLADPPRVARAALIAGRIVNETQERSHPGVVRALSALADRWRDKTGLPIVAVEAPAARGFDGTEPLADDATQKPICVGLLVDRVSADDGPRRTHAIPALRAEVDRANAVLADLWPEVRAALDGLVRESFEGYGDDRDLWRRANGAALSDDVALHLVAFPYDTKAHLAFGVARANPAEGFDWVQGKTDRMEPQSRGVAGAAVLATNPDAAYVRPVDLSDAAHAVHRERVAGLKGKTAYFIVASNVAG